MKDLDYLRQLTVSGAPLQGYYKLVMGICESV